MTIQTILKKAPATKLAMAKALLSSVRELEQNDKGIYSAFVDHDKDSFDVSIVLSEKLQVKKNDCDCEDKDKPCIHVLAVLQAIYNGQKNIDKATQKIKNLKKTR